MALFDRFKKKAEDAAETVVGKASDVERGRPRPLEEAVDAADVGGRCRSPSRRGRTRGRGAAIRRLPEGAHQARRRGLGRRSRRSSPSPASDLIYSVTGGGIHPVAQRIADLTGGKPFDGFKSKADFHEIAVCGDRLRRDRPHRGLPDEGCAHRRCARSQPVRTTLMRFINEENFVSGVRGVTDVEVIE